jgi:hypothetical protein
MRSWPRASSWCSWRPNCGPADSWAHKRPGAAALRRVDAEFGYGDFSNDPVDPGGSGDTWSMDWSAVGSTVLGAGIGFAGTYWAQKMSLADARQARLDANQDVAIAMLSESFTGILQLIRSVPLERFERIGGRKIEKPWQEVRAAEKLWTGQLLDLLGPAAVAVETLLDKDLRTRLVEVFDLLEHWEGLEDAFHGWYGPAVLRRIAKHGVALLGAYAREEPLPAPGEVYQGAKQALDLKNDLMSMEYDQEAERRRTSKENDDGQDEAQPTTELDQP